MKEMILKATSQPFWQFLVILILVLITHAPMLFAPNAENPDSGFLYPILRELSFPFEYFKTLAELETYDFQPVRDMTFYIDIFLQDLFKVPVGVFLNAILWAAICYSLMQLIAIIRKELPGWRELVFTCCIAVYPIFYQAVNWGIARKHLLACFFILMATKELERWESEKNNSGKVIIAYVLSILSMPIAIGWPVYVIARLGLMNILYDKKAKLLLVSLGIIGLITAAINYEYYNTSLTYLAVYPKKLDLTPTFVLYHLGLQVRQLLFPYDLSFNYNYQLMDFVWFHILFAFSILIFWLSRKHPRIHLLPLLGGLAMIVTASSPHFYYDTYVLIPGLMMFAFIATQFPSFVRKITPVMIIPLIIWSVLTWQGSVVWSDGYEFYKQGYTKFPNCSNAVMLGIRTYQKGFKVMPVDLYDYLQVNDCLGQHPKQTPANRERVLQLEALMMYFEDDVDMEYREKRFHELGKRSLRAKMTFAAFLAKYQKAEKLEQITGEINNELTESGNEFPVAFDFVFLQAVPAYCQKEKLPNCLKLCRRSKSRIVAD